MTKETVRLEGCKPFSINYWLRLTQNLLPEWTAQRTFRQLSILTCGSFQIFLTVGYGDFHWKNAKSMFQLEAVLVSSLSSGSCSSIRRLYAHPMAMDRTNNHKKQQLGPGGHLFFFLVHLFPFAKRRATRSCWALVGRVVVCFGLLWTPHRGHFPGLGRGSPHVLLWSWAQSGDLERLWYYITVFICFPGWKGSTPFAVAKGAITKRSTLHLVCSGLLTGKFIGQVSP